MIIVQHSAREANMEQVTGIGGLFFRARDPKALGQWYQDHLGVALVPSNYEEPPWQQEAGPTVFTPFPETADYFGPDASKTWIVNFRVRSLDAMVAQLRAAGVSVEVDPQLYPNGRFTQDHLGVALVPSNYEEPPWQQEAGPTVFTPFPETADYFGPDASKTWIVKVI